MAKQDPEALLKEMKGFGADEAALIKIVANRTNSQLNFNKLKVPTKILSEGI